MSNLKEGTIVRLANNRTGEIIYLDNQSVTLFSWCKHLSGYELLKIETNKIKEIIIM